jgi:hypothetical protein
MPRGLVSQLMMPDARLKDTTNGFAVMEKTLFQDLHQSVREQL